MNRTGFTLIELLVVVSLIAVIAAMILSVPKRMDNEESVRSAALELAGVMRDTRERAIRQRSIYAVSFNIANAPGSSGQILNNHSGGHWYRVLGPDAIGSSAAGTTPWTIPTPPLFSRIVGLKGRAVPVGWSDNPIRHFLESMERSWVGDRIQLPTRKVRFLALTDQDNGNFRDPGDTYAPTYPRPWFGWYDPDINGLRAWGGYDPALPMTTQTGLTAYKPRVKSGRTISHSGFYYEGEDGIITGCVNPTDRIVHDDTNGDGIIALPGSTSGSLDDLTQSYHLGKENESRPLIDGTWGDYLILFRPDGTAFCDWMRLRHEYAKNDSWTPAYLGGPSKPRYYDPSTTIVDATPANGYFNVKLLGPADRCNRRITGGLINAASSISAFQTECAIYPEASSYTKHTGSYYITLAPDAEDDTNTFGNAAAALRSITPCYRVAISTLGNVTIVKVRAGDNLGRTLDPTITGADWQVKAKTDVDYQLHGRTNASGLPVGSPVTDVITKDMLIQRAWWWQ